MIAVRQLSTRDQITQKLPTIDHLTAFKNEQSPSAKSSIKGPEMANAKQFKQNNSLIYVQNNEKRTIGVTETNNNYRITGSWPCTGI